MLIEVRIKECAHYKTFSEKKPCNDDFSFLFLEAIYKKYLFIERKLLLISIVDVSTCGCIMPISEKIWKSRQKNVTVFRAEMKK